MRILITGKQVNWEKSNHTKPNNYEIIAPVKWFGSSNSKECENIIKPDWLINSGAFTDVDSVKLKRSYIKLLRMSNVFAKGLEKWGNLLQISSDYVLMYFKSFKLMKKKSQKCIYSNLKLKNNTANIGVQARHYLRTSWLISPYGKTSF